MAFILAQSEDEDASVSESGTGNEGGVSAITCTRTQ